MPEKHLRESGFIYNTCGPFLKNKKEYKILINKISKIYLSKQTR